MPSSSPLEPQCLAQCQPYDGCLVNECWAETTRPPRSSWERVLAQSENHREGRTPCGSSGTQRKETSPLYPSECARVEQDQNSFGIQQSHTNHAMVP